MTTQKEIIKQTQKAVDIVRNAKHQGTIRKPDAKAEIGGLCGDRIEFQIKVKDNKVTEIKYNTLGCVAAIASSEVLAQKVQGKSLNTIKKLTISKLIKELGLPNVKHHCAEMALDSLKAAIEDYQKKH